MPQGLLDRRLKRKLLETHARMLLSGELLSLQRLDECYSLFRARFGPDALRQLDGELLLERMHTHGKDSLVYWLEFKNDEEFPGVFGSIAGGSAHKFGIFRKRDTGVWVTGSPQRPKELSVAEAVDVARRHRDELVAGSEILAGLPCPATDEEYSNLQKELNGAAPSVCDLAWGHKYFSLLFPNKLDDYHAVEHQRFHLVKLLLRPPEGEGRYLTSGTYVRLARELEWPMNHLTTVLNRVHGRPYRAVASRNGFGQSKFDLADDARQPLCGNWMAECGRPVQIRKQSRVQVTDRRTPRKALRSASQCGRQEGARDTEFCRRHEGRRACSGRQR